MHKTKAKHPQTKSTHNSEWPDAVEMQLPEKSRSIPEGSLWIHELKLDGYRILALVKDKKVTLLNRSGHDWTNRYPHLEIEFLKLGLTDAIIDGQLVPHPSQNNVVFFAFDLLFLNGQDLRHLSLEERKLQLKQILKKCTSKYLYFSNHTRESGKALLEKAEKFGFSGIISKHRFQPYQPGRNENWQSFTFYHHQDFVVIGYTQKHGRGKYALDEILLGTFTGRKIAYVGKIKINFDKTNLKQISEFVHSTPDTLSPLKTIPSGLGKVNWVKPKLVLEIKFKGWTPKCRIKGASFYSIREDKLANPEEWTRYR